VAFLQALPRAPSPRSAGGAGRLQHPAGRTAWRKASSMSRSTANPKKVDELSMPAPVRRALRDRRRAGPSLRQAQCRALRRPARPRPTFNRQQWSSSPCRAHLREQDGSAHSSSAATRRLGQSMAMRGWAHFIPICRDHAGLRVRALNRSRDRATIQVYRARPPHGPHIGAFVREILAFSWVNPAPCAGPALGARAIESNCHSAFQIRTVRAPMLRHRRDRSDAALTARDI